MSTENTDVIQDTTENGEVVKQYFENFGYESEDAFKSDFEALRELKSKEQEILTKSQQYENDLAFLGSVEVDEDPEIETLKALKKKGIPTEVATRIMTTDDAALVADPLRALLYAEAVSNPTAYAKGKSKIEQAIREKYNLPSEGDYTPTALMEYEAIQAVEKINKIKSEVGEIKNPIKFAKEQQAERQAQFGQRQQAAFGELKSVTEGLKEVDYTFGEHKVSLQVSKEDIEAVLKSQAATVLGHFKEFDPTTKEGKAELKKWATNQILSHKFQTGQLGVEIANSLQVATEKKVVKEAHNGQAIVDRTGTKTKDGKELTPLQKRLIAEGKTPPSLVGKNQ